MTIVRWHASLLVTAGSRAVSGKLLQQPGVQVSMPQTQLCAPIVQLEITMVNPAFARKKRSRTRLPSVFLCLTSGLTIVLLY